MNVKQAISTARKDPLPVNLALYEVDFHAWIEAQTALLREGRNDDIDAENLIEELRDITLRLEDELAEALIDIICGLLIWQHEPARPTPNRTSTIELRRRDIQNLMARSPGLQSAMQDMLAYCYDIGRLRFFAGNELPDSSISENCPYSMDDLIKRPVQVETAPTRGKRRSEGQTR
jgi:Domain of unknown function DUF29